VEALTGGILNPRSFYREFGTRSQASTGIQPCSKAVEHLPVTQGIRVQLPARPLSHFMWNCHFYGDFEKTQLQHKNGGNSGKTTAELGPAGLM